ncbi:MAG: histidine phosphatase family protein [Actinobacteria bacterium]|nr:histidine phosphatase family protein [Actinomycetota bacterium]
MTLILVRHGQTAANAEGRLQGRLDAPLTELGRRQAAAIAAAVARPGRVISSPLARCLETAEVFGLPVEVDERWIEIDYGALDGVPLAAVPAAVWSRWRTDRDFVPAGGESMAEVKRRVDGACEELATEASTTEVVVVSHVSPIKAAVSWALGVSEAASWRMFLDLAAVCRISVGPPGPSLLTFNERTHLAGAGASTGRGTRR